MSTLPGLVQGNSLTFNSIFTCPIEGSPSMIRFELLLVFREYGFRGTLLPATRFPDPEPFPVNLVGVLICVETFSKANKKY